MRTLLCRRHRFPAEIIRYSVWLSFRYTLSFRDIEEMLAMRGISPSHETVREWCLKFGQTYAKRPAPQVSSPATGGTLMKSSSRSMEVFITYGGP